MCEQGQVAEGATCLALIGTCAKARRWQLAEEVFRCTISCDVGLQFVDCIGPADTSNMLDNDKELFQRLQNWRQRRPASPTEESLVGMIHTAPIHARWWQGGATGMRSCLMATFPSRAVRFSALSKIVPHSRRCLFYAILLPMLPMRSYVMCHMGSAVELHVLLCMQQICEHMLF
jgi:hypothetical protein